MELTEMSYSRFLSECRSIKYDRPRAFAGHIAALFSQLFPHISQTGWTEYDMEIVLAYHLIFNDSKKGGKPLGAKALNNYKAAKVMLSDLQRGIEMLSDSSKQIHKILKLYKEEDPVMAPKTEGEKAKAKTEKPKSVSIRGIILTAIVEHKLTDEQIAALVKQKTNKELRQQYLTSHRRRLNKGVFAKYGFAKPQTEIEPVLSKADAKAAEVKAKAATKPAPKTAAKAATVATASAAAVKKLKKV